MRYEKDHKQQTHARVLQIAAKALREKGPDGVSVAEVMQTAGLTHGGFYAHFLSKDAFLAETLTMIFAQAGERMKKLLEGLPPRHALATYVDYYVSVAHRNDPGRGCPVAALSSDLPRQSRKFRAAFDAGTKILVDALAQRIAVAGIADAEALAAPTLSAMVGAVSLARAISDRQLSDDLLASARGDIKARLGLTDAALSRA
jgi:TetR/AcrR family transcriptional regulator, transcriptional repressor for nem operon